jgi:hypothetical protein
MQWNKIAPGLSLLFRYDRSQLRYDELAALVVTLALIPSAFAYSESADCAPAAGFYASIGGMAAFALLHRHGKLPASMRSSIRRLHMNDDKSTQHRDANSELQSEIREGRKFTLEEAIGRMVGPGAMKGESPVARLRQAEVEIGSWLRIHLVDSGGALETVLHRDVKASELLLKNFDEPLVVLANYCRQILDSDYLLAELVRNADVEWGRLMGERPLFERTGTDPQPEDPYTLESVRTTVSELLKQLTAYAK